MAYVYKLKHKTNGRFYIGYRCRNEVDLGTKYFTSSKHINKDNFNEFDIEILAEELSRDAAYNLEQQTIYKHWEDVLIINESCYYGKQRFRNKPGYTLSEDFCKRRSELVSGKNNPMYGKRGELSPLYGRKRPDQSEFMKENNPTKGKQRSERIKQEHSERMKGRVPHNKGKTWEEIYGPKRAAEMKANLRQKNLKI